MKGRRTWSDFQMALAVALLLPPILLGLPFVLPYLAWQERRRSCPVCGRRGTLHVVPPSVEGTADRPNRREKRRIAPDTVRFRCRHCGSGFGRAELRASGVPV